MTIDAKLIGNDKILRISVTGDFDFSVLRDFRKAYSDEDYKHCKIIIDLTHTSSLDSSALGMLLAMQQYFEKPDGEISIINANKDVGKIFEITHFNQKFSIS